jgi:hypothetical protein
MSIDTTLLEALIAATPTPGGYWTKQILEELLDNIDDLDARVISAALTAVTTDATLAGNGTASAGLSVANPMPAITSSAETLVLTVVSGATTATWSAPASGLPEITSSSDTLVLAVISGTTSAVWTTAPTSLPEITSSSDTLVLTVISGQTTATWSLGTPGPTGATGAAGADGADGADGGFDSVQTIKSITANYTLTIDEAGALVKATAEAIISVPLNSSVAFSTGQHIDIVAYTSASVTVAAISAGVTIRQPYGDRIKVKYGAATLVKMAADEWLLIGDCE